MTSTSSTWIKESRVCNCTSHRSDIVPIKNAHSHATASVELPHVQLVGARALDDRAAVEYVFKLNLIQTTQVALQC